MIVHVYEISLLCKFLGSLVPRLRPMTKLRERAKKQLIKLFFFKLMLAVSEGLPRATRRECKAEGTAGQEIEI